MPLETLRHTEWEVSADLDRVGVRLSGPALARSHPEELPSEGIVAGAVQVPPSGHPIIFLADHPTTGAIPSSRWWSTPTSTAPASSAPATASASAPYPPLRPGPRLRQSSEENLPHAARAIRHVLSLTVGPGTEGRVRR